MSAAPCSGPPFHSAVTQGGGIELAIHRAAEPDPGAYRVNRRVLREVLVATANSVNEDSLTL